MPELATKADLLAMEQRLRASIRGSPELRVGFTDLNAHLEILTLRLTIRFGVMLAVWVVVAAIILKRV
jgi:hypothetical protein